MDWKSSQLVGGHPLLDFVNTVGDETKTRSTEWLSNWGAFRSWASCTESGADLLGAIDAVPRIERGTLLGQLIDLRRELYGYLSKLCRSETAPSIPDQLVFRIQSALQRSQLVASNSGAMCWQPTPNAEQAVMDTMPLWLEDLCRKEDLLKVRQCRRCTWFFIDRGRGKGRQWCSMSTCGNRAKAERFRESQHQ